MSNIKDLLQVKFISFKPSPSVRDYIQKKIAKHELKSKEVLEIICNVSLDSSRAGKTYTMAVEVSMPHAGFIVRGKGNDVYRLVDEVSDKYRNRLTKFLDKQNSNNSDSDTSMMGSEERYFIEEFIEDYGRLNASVPDGPKYRIIEKKGFYDNSPLHIDEAIEIMEMIGRPCFLFKNIDTGKYNVVYRVEGKNGRSGYGLIEPRVS